MTIATTSPDPDISCAGIEGASAWLCRTIPQPGLPFGSSLGERLSGALTGTRKIGQIDAGKLDTLRSELRAGIEKRLSEERWAQKNGLMIQLCQGGQNVDIVLAAFRKAGLLIAQVNFPDSSTVLTVHPGHAFAYSPNHTFTAKLAANGEESC